MGSRNPDRVPLAFHRGRCETVQQMIDQGWEVSSRCQVCRMELRVDLPAIACLRGPKFSLWNRRSRCKGLHCRGVVNFYAKAPGMGWPEPLQAERGV
jgi:hypothetical protein